MLDTLLPQLKSAIGGDLTGKLGLDNAKADGALNAAISSVKEVIGSKGADMGTLMNLFSKDANNSAANGLLGDLGTNYLSKLTGDMGLDAAKAGSVKDMVIPVITKLLTDKIGGNKDLLGGLLGGGLKDKVSGLAGKIGGIGKLFGN